MRTATYFKLCLMLATLCGCQALTKPSVVIVKQFDYQISLVQDADNNLYFQSIPSDVCQYHPNYWREDKANRYIAANKQHIPTPLNELLDVNSLKMTKKIQYQYYFEDKQHTYLLIKTMCDHTLGYQPKSSTNTINPK